MLEAQAASLSKGLAGWAHDLLGLKPCPVEHRGLEVSSTVSHMLHVGYIDALVEDN